MPRCSSCTAGPRRVWTRGPRGRLLSKPSTLAPPCTNAHQEARRRPRLPPSRGPTRRARRLSPATNTASRTRSASALRAPVDTSASHRFTPRFRRRNDGEEDTRRVFARRAFGLVERGPRHACDAALATPRPNATSAAHSHRTSSHPQRRRPSETRSRAAHPEGLAPAAGRLQGVIAPIVGLALGVRGAASW